MDITEAFKNKLLILADHENASAQKIKSILNKLGFKKIAMAHDGSKIYELLRPYHDKPNDVGLLIVNEDLPQCHIQEMCRVLSSENKGADIPVIILTQPESDSTDIDTYNLTGKNLVFPLKKSCNNSEFIMLIRLLLMLKQERSLRYKQEEQLINELADRKIMDNKLKYFVAYDELTGLLNRTKFEHHIKLILNRDSNIPQQGYVLFIDIDRFGLVNELEGYDAGDRLIIDIVDIIRKTVLFDCLFSRIGSDEFCLYLEKKTPAQVLEITQNIRKNIENFRFLSSNACYNITVSIGIAPLFSSKAVVHPGDLIARAHKACTMAKENGRNQIREYSDKDEIIKERHRDLYWLPIIRDALREQRFNLVYQPIVDLYNGNISHYEVLLRMQGSSSTISPCEFIPVAERMGLIHSIDLWVIENAIDFLASLPAKMSHICLSINLSSIAFQYDNLLPAIKQKLEMNWVKPQRIIFEMTETAAIDNFEKSIDMVVKIRALGCQFALDDFGTGFCSFNYLKRFPVDFIKIDGQFIQNLQFDETDQVLVKSICEIAQKLGKKTIAEYVENPKLIDLLQTIGVDFGQGYIFGKPEAKLLKTDILSFTQLSQKQNPDKQTWDYSDKLY